ncbi:MAG: TRIC cation channel family protein [Clostridia bacterium]|nr:TRIC cation channel family protein [Clostridia bacterium]
MTGIKYGLDMFGVVFLGGVTALGGGVTRDIMLGSFPPLMFRDYKYLITAVISSLAVFAAAYFFKDKYNEAKHEVDRINNIFDAAGLGLFTVVGTQTAIDAGFFDNAFFCIFLGVTTGVGGGILRDIIIQSTPMILKKHIYAIASLVGAVMFYTLCYFGVEYITSLFTSSCIVFVIRMLATKYKWNFPKA